MIKENNKKNISVNNKGFTLMEIIAVVIILGIIIVISGIAVTSYIEDSKAKTYESYKKDLEVASENYLINCMAENEENCEIPQKGNNVIITYNELVNKGYSDKLKDPEGNGYCDKSYVIAKYKDSAKGVTDLEYQVCLFCSKYDKNETGCVEPSSNDVTPPTCGTAKGSSTTWTKEDRVISIECTDNGTGCSKNEFSKNFGKDGEVIEKSSITIRDNSGNTKSCSVNVYVDKKAPTCKIEVDGEMLNGWYKSKVTARITSISDEGSSANDKSSIEYGMGTSLNDRNYNGSTSYTVENGIVTVFGYVKDAVGNEGYCSKEIKVDTTHPEATLYMGYEVYPKENTTIEESVVTVNNLKKYGTIEGVIVYFYNLVGESPSYITNESDENIKVSGGIAYDDEKAIFKVTPGTYNKLNIEISDLGELEENIKKIEVLKKETVTSIWTNKDVSVYVEVNDTGTGLFEEPYSFDGGNTFVENNIYTYDKNAKGTVIVVDQTGNESDEYEFTINKIDKTKPNKPTVKIAKNNDVVINYSSSTTYEYPVYIVGDANNKKPSATDSGGSGIYKYQISKDNSSWLDWSYNSNSDYYALTTTGEHKRYVRAIDNAGNISNPLELTINVNTSFKLVEHILANNTAQSDNNIDFSKPSAQVYYKSVKSSETSNEYFSNWHYCASQYQFDEVTGVYTLSAYADKCQTVMNGNLDYKYTCLSNEKTCKTLYELKTYVSGKTRQEFYQHNAKFSYAGTENGKGLYYTSTNTEDNKITYYFRGNVENNYVVINQSKYYGCNDGECTSLSGDMYDTFDECYVDYGDGCSKETEAIVWRIVRINEDGSVRIVLDDGISYDDFYDEATEGYYGEFNIGYGNSPFNSVSYMKSTDPGFNNLPYIEYYNEYNSDIKNYLDEWYSRNLDDILKGKVADSGFCNDRESTYEYGKTIRYNSDVATMVEYLSYDRIKNKPQFACPNKSIDLFTVHNQKGNKRLLYPIGLLTVDELVYAGAAYGYSSNYYLANGSDWWTMTPYKVESSYTQNCDIEIVCKDVIECYEDTITYPEDMACSSDYELYGFTNEQDCVDSQGQTYKDEVCFSNEVCEDIENGECVNEFEVVQADMWIGNGNCIGTRYSSNSLDFSVRPVINLISSVRAISGDGTKENPYVIDTN